MEKIDLGRILQKDEKKLPRSSDGVLLLELIKTEKYSIAYGELLPKEKNKNHRLAQEETYYFLEGEGKHTIDGKITTVKKITKALTTLLSPSTKKILFNAILFFQLYCLIL